MAAFGNLPWSCFGLDDFSGCIDRWRFNSRNLIEEVAGKDWLHNPPDCFAGRIFSFRFIRAAEEEICG